MTRAAIEMPIGFAHCRQLAFFTTRQANWLAQRLAMTVFFATAMAAPALAISNGTPDDGQPPRFPNVGAIVADKIPLPFAGLTPPQTISSGTLIHPQVVLTAGHSLEFMDELVGLPTTDGSTMTIQDFSVTFDFDAHDDSTATYHRVKEIAYPPDYIPFEGSGRPEASRDFGFVVLMDPVMEPTPVSFPEAGFLEVPANREGRFTAVGYGYTEPFEEYPPPPFAGGTQLIPSGQRHSSESEFRVLRGNYVLLSHNLAQGFGGVTTGDSGGPIFANDPRSGQEVQVGVISSGDKAGAKLGVHFRTDTSDFLDLIQTENLEAYLGLNSFAAPLASGTATAIAEPSSVLLVLATTLAVWFPRKRRHDHVTQW